MLVFRDQLICIKYRTRFMLIFIIRLGRRHANFDRCFITLLLIIVMFWNSFLSLRCSSISLCLSEMLLLIMNRWIIALIESRLPLITIVEAEGLILAQELRLRKYNKLDSSSNTFAPSVNLTQASFSQFTDSSYQSSDSNAVYVFLRF